MKKYYKLFRYLIPYKWNAFQSILYNVFGAIFSLFSLAMIIPFMGVLFGTVKPLEVKPVFAFNPDAIIDYFNYTLGQIVLDYGQGSALLFVVALVVVTSLFKNFFTYLALWHMAPIRNGVVRDIRNELYAKVLELPLGYYSEERKGDIISKMTNDVNEIEVSIIRSLEMFFKEPVIIIVHLVGLIAISPKLTLFVLLMLPITGGVIGRVGKNLRKSSFKGQKKLGSLLTIMDETLGGLRIIKAFNAEGKMTIRFREVNAYYSDIMIRMWRRRDLATPLSEFLGTIVVVTILWYGGKIVIEGNSSLNAGALISFVAMFYMIINPVKSFSSAYFNVLKGMASADRIDSVLNAQNTIKSTAGAIKINDFNASIEYRNVSFRYGNEFVLKNINVTIEKGKTVALVGQSGSGKSTFIDLLPRFYDVVEGEILIDGINIKNYNLVSLRSIMGNVNQESILFNDTFYNNIAFGVEGANEEQVIAAAKIANAHEFIVASPEGYNTSIGDRGGKLSGGQRQRISIARAILKNPPIMILDEATSALDTESERLVQDAIEKLMKNRTSLVIAHRLSTVKNADLICVLHEGEIVERGTHDELLEIKGAYYRLYQMQS
jgi:subfamily B ATP-binding cassette protein MsbA